MENPSAANKAKAAPVAALSFHAFVLSKVYLFEYMQNTIEYAAPGLGNW